MYAQEESKVMMSPAQRQQLNQVRGEQADRNRDALLQDANRLMRAKTLKAQKEEVTAKAKHAYE